MRYQLGYARAWRQPAQAVRTFHLRIVAMNTLVPFGMPLRPVWRDTRPIRSVVGSRLLFLRASRDQNTRPRRPTFRASDLCANMPRAVQLPYLLAEYLAWSRSWRQKLQYPHTRRIHAVSRRGPRPNK